MVANPSPSESAAEREYATHEMFRLLVDSVVDYAIFLLDPHGNVVTWNGGAERIKGWRADEIIGRHFSAFCTAEDVQAGRCVRELETAARDGRFEEEGWRVRKDGTRFWASVVLTPLRAPDGTLLGYAKVTHDLTMRKQAEEQRAARLAAEQASRAKDEFLAMLGHELRNPMAPILTALQLMKLRNAGTGREQQIIERQVRYMNHLIDDLLDISRITRGKIVLRKRRVDLRTVVANAIEVASPLLEQHNHHLQIAAPRHPICVDGDEARLTQVFSNLLTNAAKYTQPGGHIAVRFRTDGGAVVVEVEDDGMGIDASLLPRVFELFVQGYQGAERSSGGLGLGLTLVRALAEMHGGTVTAHSDGPGRGSMFAVRLRIADGQVADPPAPNVRRIEQVGQPRRILLVDDNDDARELLVDALEAVGHEVRGAADPVEALEVVRTFAPDVAVLDIGLPVMDGYELAVRLRAALADATPRLIALTGYGQPQDHVKSSDAGFDVHLVKPIDVRRLLDNIAKLEAPPRAG